MGNKEHTYDVHITWTGNTGHGTADYKTYTRDHTIAAGDKAEIAGSADPAFRGDPGRWNPEDLLVASISACHKLWYLHLCAVSGISVQAYRDDAVGTMIEDPKKGGYFKRVLLRPHVTIREGDDVALATRLHHQAHEKCFIANSVNFPIDHEPTIITA